MAIDWTPMYINTVIANKSKQAIDADYWNALWNLVISQADHNTEGMVAVLDQFEDVDSLVNSILDENGKIQLDRLPSSVIGTDPYPVGSIYMNINSTNPGVLFGGTWTRLKDSFLVGYGDNTDEYFALESSSTISESDSSFIVRDGSSDVFTISKYVASGTNISVAYTRSYNGSVARDEVTFVAGTEEELVHPQGFRIAYDGSRSFTFSFLNSSSSGSRSMFDVSVSYVNSDAFVPNSIKVYMWRRVA